MTTSLHDRWRRLLGAFAILALLASVCSGALVGSRAGAATTPTWSQLAPPTAPPALAYAAAAYDSDNSTVVMFGGAGAHGALSADTWVWNGSNWTRFASNVPARELASMAFDPVLHQLILFGGLGNGGQLLNDTWAWNGASWYQVDADADATLPPAREGASLAFDANDQLVLFGGSAGTTPAGSSNAPAAGAAAPVGAAATPTASTLGDTWVWTGSSWTQQSVPGPPSRTDAGLVWDGSHHQNVLFGGSSAPEGTTPPTGMLGDTWLYGGGSWTQSQPAASPPPAQGLSMATDTDLGGVVEFGGNTATGLSGDTWLWNGTNWSKLSTTRAPAARVGAAMAYDATAHQLVLFGGAGPGGTVLSDTSILTLKAPAVEGLAPSAPGNGRPGSGSGSSATSPTSNSVARPGASTSTTRGSGTSAQPGHNSASGTPHLTARRLRRGDLMVLSGTGFRPATAITITFHSTPYLVGRTATDANGDFTATVAIPTAASAGLHHFEASGMGATGQLLSLVTPVEVVVAVVHHHDLVQTIIMLALAVALPAGTWLAMELNARRRRHGLVGA